MRPGGIGNLRGAFSFMALSKAQIEALNGLNADDKKGLLDLIADLDKANEEITTLRKKQPNDSQLIVSKTDHEALNAAIKTRDEKISTLEMALKKFDVPANASDLDGLSWFANLFA